jgi:hypothetical protein
MTKQELVLLAESGCTVEEMQTELMRGGDLAASWEGVYIAVYYHKDAAMRVWLRQVLCDGSYGPIELAEDWPLYLFWDACQDGDERYVEQEAEIHPQWLEEHSQAGNNVLAACARGGQMGLLERLLERTRWKEWGDCDALHAAARAGHMEVVVALVERFGMDVAGLDSDGATVLKGACEGGAVAIVDYLLSAGAEMNEPDRMGMTPLHFAVRAGQLDVARLLIGRGARTQVGESLLQCACEGGKIEAVQYLESIGYAMVPTARGVLHAACRSGNVELVEYLVKHGFGIDSRDKEGNTPLHIASAWHHRPATRWLLRHGADVQSRNREGDTPLRRSTKGYGVTDPYLLSHPQSLPEDVLTASKSLPGMMRKEVARCPGGVIQWARRHWATEMRLDLLAWRRAFVEEGVNPTLAPSRTCWSPP